MSPTGHPAAALIFAENTAALFQLHPTRAVQLGSFRTQLTVGWPWLRSMAQSSDMKESNGTQPCTPPTQ
jgi:hypothetical protein